MQPTVYQKPEIRDANDNIIQQGAFGKNTALANSTNDGWIDYVANDLEFLYDLAKDEVVPVPSLPASGQTNKTYLLTTTGVSYRWSGTEWVAVSSSEAVGRAESAALLAEQWATKTDGTVDGTEYSAKYYAEQAEASADDAQDTADDMATHLVQIDKNTGGVAKNSKRISNIEKLLQGNLYDYQTDSTSAYTKSVPSGAMPYAGLEQIGGKTIVWNQLVNTGTTTVSTISGRKYYTLIDGTASIVTADGTAITIVDDTADMVCDLTLLFGAGNEPSTVAEFESMFPASYYSYNAGTLLSAGVTEVESVGKNLLYIQSPSTSNTVDGVTVSYDADTKTFTYSGTNSNPSSHIILTLFPDIFNLSIGETYMIHTTNPIPANTYINFVYVSKNGEIRALKYFTTNNDGFTVPADFDRFSKMQLSVTGEATTIPTTSFQIQVEKGSTATAYSPYQEHSYSIPASIQALEGYGWSAGSVYNYVDFERKAFVKNVGSRAYASGDESDSTVITDGTTTYYPLTTAVETDISQYLTDDNLINVESGGTLTFHNSNGDDYRLPVPSEEEYMIDLQSAIGGLIT